MSDAEPHPPTPSDADTATSGPPPADADETTPDRPPAPPEPETFPDAALKNRTLAAALSWLVPGLGQIYQGRTGKGALFAVCVIGMFAFGLFLGRGHVVYVQFQGPWYEWRLHYFAQVFAGLPALPALGQYALVSQGFEPITEFEAPPYRDGEVKTSRGIDRLTMWHLDEGMNFDIGTIYTMLAGLLNIFVILDAFGGPLPPPPSPEESERTDEPEPATG